MAVIVSISIVQEDGRVLLALSEGGPVRLYELSDGALANLAAQSVDALRCRVQTLRQTTVFPKMSHAVIA